MLNELCFIFLSSFISFCFSQFNKCSALLLQWDRWWQSTILLWLILPEHWGALRNSGEVWIWIRSDWLRIRENLQIFFWLVLLLSVVLRSSIFASSHLVRGIWLKVVLNHLEMVVDDVLLLFAFDLLLSSLTFLKHTVRGVFLFLLFRLKLVFCLIVFSFLLFSLSSHVY